MTAFKGVKHILNVLKTSKIDSKYILFHVTKSYIHNFSHFLFPYILFAKALPCNRVQLNIGMIKISVISNWSTFVYRSVYNRGFVEACICECKLKHVES